MSANGKNDFNHQIPKKELPFHKKRLRFKLKNTNLALGAARGTPRPASDVDLQPWHPQRWSTCAAPAPAPSAVVVAAIGS